jgi:hypothetical protein
MPEAVCVERTLMCACVCVERALCACVCLCVDVGQDALGQVTYLQAIPALFAW